MALQVTRIDLEEYPVGSGQFIGGITLTHEHGSVRVTPTADQVKSIFDIIQPGAVAILTKHIKES